MATMLPNAAISASPQKTDTTQPGQRYQNRTYQPYVFQPNFLKQQMRQRDIEKAAHLGQHGDPGPAPSIQLTLRSSNSALASSIPQAVVDEMINRKKSGRKVIDWTSSCAIYLERRRWQREFEDVPSLLPDPTFSIEMQATMAYKNTSASSVATKFVRSATNKMKCPVYKVVWTPDGRRLVTGSASGEFTLWNGTAFNFETILQAHDSPVRAMSWSRNDAWLITGDNQGYIKYWQLNMNNVKMYQAHKDQACRSVCFGPTDSKFVTASDDGTVRVWDFLRCHEEHILRGHGADVKQVDWHPQKCLIASASKDLHTPVKLWDPRVGQSLATIHAHKGTVMDVKFNRNGNWFLTASRDHLIKLYDIRNLKEERQVFRGHKKEAFSVAWHPIHEDMFASGGSEGSILYWQVGEDKEVGILEGAHDSLIWSLAWHPLGHILVSGSNDHSTKFWTRNRPGDSMKDRYNLFPGVEDTTSSKSATATSNAVNSDVTHIPGMGDTEAVAAEIAKREEEQQKSGIPGLDWSFEEKNEFERKMIISSHNDNRKKIPYARPVPRSFAAAWESNKEGKRRRKSRSPSPHRYNDPPSGWRRKDPPPRGHRSSVRSRHPDDFIAEERHPGMDFEQSRVSRPPVEERLLPMEFPPNHPPAEHRDTPRDVNDQPFQDDNFKNKRLMHDQRPDERPQFNDPNTTDFNPSPNFEQFGDKSLDQKRQNIGIEPPFAPTDRSSVEGMPPHSLGPNRGRGRNFSDHRRLPPEVNNWSQPVSTGSDEPLFSESGVPLNPEALYGSDYAELLAMDQEFEEAILANFDLQQEAMALSNRESTFPPDGPPMRGRGKPRGFFRGGQSRGRDRGRGGPRFSMEQNERGRMRRKMRRGGFD